MPAGTVTTPAVLNVGTTPPLIGVAGVLTTRVVLPPEPNVAGIAAPPEPKPMVSPSSVLMAGYVAPVAPMVDGMVSSSATMVGAATVTVSVAGLQFVGFNFSHKV